MRSLPALVAAGLIVLGGFAAALAMSSPSRFLSGAREGENPLPEGLPSASPTPNSAGGAVIAAIPVGNGPSGIAYDGGNGYVYVAVSNYTNCEPGCVRPGNVSVIAGTNVLSTVPVGNGPFGVAYDSGNGYVYVTNLGSNNVSVINGTIVVAAVPVGINPHGVAYDSRNGYVYVANENSNNVTVINGTTVVATIPVGNLPYGVAYNSGSGDVYVANFQSQTVSVISTTKPLFLVTFTETGLPSKSSWSVILEGLSNSSATPTITFSQPNGTHSYSVGRVTGYAAYYYPSPSPGSVTVNGAPSNVTISFMANTKGGTVIATVSVGNYPVGAAYNSGNSYVYVANSVSNSVSLISGTTVVATVPIGYGASPLGVAYNSGNGYVYVSNYGQNTVSVIDGTTVIATVPVGNLPRGVAYNSGNGYVYVANSLSNNVSVIGGTTVLATIPVDYALSALAYNSGNGCVYVARYYSGTVSVICAAAQLSLVTFTETGLPSGTSWSVTLGSLSNSSTSPTITFPEPDGLGSYAVSRSSTSAAYYDPSPSSGRITVNRAPLNVTISFTAITAGGIVVATIPVGGYPTGVAYDSGNGYVYVANGANNVSVIDGSTLVATIPVGGYPTDVAYDSGNGDICVTSCGSENVNGV